MDYIPAYCSMSFLEEVFTHNPFDSINPDKLSNVKSQLNLLELLIDGSYIKVDEEAEEVKKIAASNPFIMKLIKGQRIDAGIKDFSEIQSNSDSYFREQKKDNRIYFTSPFRSLHDASFQEKSGYIFQSPRDNYDFLFSEEIRTFNPSQEMNWSFAKEALNPHHSLIIADPYVFDNLKPLVDFLRSIIPRNLKCTYHLTIIGASESIDIISKKIKEHFREQIEKIELALKDLGIKYIAEYFTYNRMGFHDRYLITNNCCVFQGSGIDIIKGGEAKKEGTWTIFRPYKKVNINGQKGVFFYKVMQDKIATLKRWVEKSDNYSPEKGIKNPLFHL